MGLLQEKRNSIANALELRLSNTNPWILWFKFDRSLQLSAQLTISIGIGSGNGLMLKENAWPELLMTQPTSTHQLPPDLNELRQQ